MLTVLLLSLKQPGLNFSLLKHIGKKALVRSPGLGVGSLSANSNLTLTLPFEMYKAFSHALFQITLNKLVRQSFTMIPVLGRRKWNLREIR